MVESICFKIFERFSAHRWAKSRHVLLIALWISSCFFSSKTAFSKKDHIIKTKNRDNTTFKKIPVLFLGLSLCFLCFSIVGSGLSSAATVYVTASGSGDYICDGTNDHVEINKALAYVKSTGGGTVYLKGPNTYWIDSTLNIGANTKLTGDSTAEIKLVSKAGWSSGIPMIRGETGASNIVVTGFTIDGNSENQGVSFGNGYYNLINFENSNNIEVSHMRLEWGCNDGVQIKKGNNILFTHNNVYKMGHDAFYALYCNKGEVAYNTVFTRTNSACRLSGGITDFIVHDNTFYSDGGGTSTGPGIEIDKTGSSTTLPFDNIEIYNNKIHSIRGSGIWMFAAYPDNTIRAKNVYIHHNTFTKVGQHASNTGYTNAAITMQNFDNTIIENNVFDDGGNAAIKWYAWSGYVAQQKAQFTTYVRNNVIMNNDGMSGVTGSGVGIWNTQSSYAKFMVQNNNFYNNKNGDTYGGGFTMSNNVHEAPSTSSSTVVNQIDAAPVANAGADKTATVGSSVSFDASASTDDKGIASYSWDFDASNGITSEATGKTATKTYTTAGTYTVTLTVTDTAGQKATDTVTVVVGGTTTTTPPASTTAEGSVAYPTYDNGLRTSSPTSVFSTVNYIDIGTNSASCRDIMMFDLSGYKTIDTISKATLSLYWYYPAGATRTSDTVVEVYRPAAEWDPKYVSWNNRASGTPWSTAGGSWYDKNGAAQGSTPYASLTFPAKTVPGNKYYDLDVTQLVQEYVSGKYKNTGFFLKARTESGNYIAFYSSEWSNAAQRPKLTVSTGESTPSSGSTVPNQVDAAPIANAGADQTVTAGSAVTVVASASTDDKGIASYSWDFDASNGITSEATGETATKTYTTAGTYTVTLTVTDTAGQKATDTVTVVVGGTTTTTPPASTTAEGSVAYPTYDNGLRTSSPTSVFSTVNYIDIGTSSASCRDIMMFDLSGYKTTDTISKATLSLYWYYPAGATRTSDTVVEVYRPAAEWDPKYVSWNNRVSGTPWSTAGGSWYDKNGAAQGSTPYASLTFPAKTVPGNKYYDLDVTQLVQEYVSGKYKNTGFFLKARTESGNYIAFYSSEWSNAAQRPKLTVTA
ncbi:MAG: Disaggregatase related repeat protein [Methanomethylovorans sp. PtaU1.Bin073]|nr:MAG: Disaggregatase related repeat protein [Methanomethylovorans sp. PtaU1.Bin073]